MMHNWQYNITEMTVRHHHDHWKNPHTPPQVLTMKFWKKEFFDYILCKPSQNQPPPPPSKVGMEICQKPSSQATAFLGRKVVHG
jgi:hypothetical protein